MIIRLKKAVQDSLYYAKKYDCAHKAHDIKFCQACFDMFNDIQETVSNLYRNNSITWQDYAEYKAAIEKIKQEYICV